MYLRHDQGGQCGIITSTQVIIMRLSDEEALKIIAALAEYPPQYQKKRFLRRCYHLAVIIAARLREKEARQRLQSML